MLTVSDELEPDYFRRLLKHPPESRDAGAHLVWVRLMSQMLLNLEGWAPHFAYALCTHERALTYLSQYGSTGHFEQSYARGIPHVMSFVEYFLDAPADLWLKDLARVEVWHASHRPSVHDEVRALLASALGISSESDRSYTIVGYDILSILQSIVGYRSTTASRVAPLLWMLGISPIRLVIEPKTAPGIVVFKRNEDATTMTYVSAEG